MGSPANPAAGNGLQANGQFVVGRITLSVVDVGSRIKMSQANTGREVEASDHTVAGILEERFFPPEDGDETAKETAGKSKD